MFKIAFKAKGADPQAPYLSVARFIISRITTVKTAEL